MGNLYNSYIYFLRIYNTRSIIICHFYSNCNIFLNFKLGKQVSPTYFGNVFLVLTPNFTFIDFSRFKTIFLDTNQCSRQNIQFRHTIKILVLQRTSYSFHQLFIFLQKSNISIGYAINTYYCLQIITLYQQHIYPGFSPQQN